MCTWVAAPGVLVQFLSLCCGAHVAFSTSDLHIVRLTLAYDSPHKAALRQQSLTLPSPSKACPTSSDIDWAIGRLGAWPDHEAEVCLPCSRNHLIESAKEYHGIA
jgi:hypothetical protein